jgi:hypothetical protein
MRSFMRFPLLERHRQRPMRARRRARIGHAAARRRRVLPGHTDGCAPPPWYDELGTMPAGAVSRSLPPPSRLPRLPGPCAPTPALEGSGRFAAPAPRRRPGVYGEAVPALTRLVDADLPVSPRVVSGMRARDDVPSLSRARGAAAFVVRRLALLRVDGPVSSLAVPMSAVCVPRPALAPRPPPIADCRCCGVPRLAWVAPPVPRSAPAPRVLFAAEPEARPAVADFAEVDRAPSPPAPAPARCVPRDAPSPRAPFAAVLLEPALFEPTVFDPARCWVVADFDAPPLRDEAARDTDALRSAAPVSARSDAPPRPAAALVVVEREAPAVPPAFAPEPRVEPAPVDFDVPDFEAPAPFDAVDFDVPFFEVALFEVALFDAPLLVVAAPEPARFAACLDVPAVFDAPLSDFDAPLPAPLPRDEAAPFPFALFDDERDDADDFFTAAPRDAVASSPPSASRALFERPACLLIVVPACAAPGAVRPPAVVAMGMLRSNVAPAGARSS